MFLELKRVHVPPGHRVILENVTWKELETIITASPFFIIAP